MASTTAYATVAEVKAQIDKSLSDKDGVLEALLLSVSRDIDGYCNRERDGFVASATASTRQFSGSGSGVQRIDECVAVSLVEVKDSADDTAFVAWTANDWLTFTGDPNAPEFEETPYTMLMVTPYGDYSYFTSGQWTGKGGFRPDALRVRGVPTVRVTARWGYAAAVPAQVKLACIIQVARMLKRGESAYADAAGSGDFGELRYTRGLDPVVQQLLKGGRLMRPAIG